MIDLKVSLFTLCLSIFTSSSRTIPTLNWTESQTPLFPIPPYYGIAAMAAGLYQDTIWLIGGDDGNTQSRRRLEEDYNRNLIQYNITRNNYTIYPDINYNLAMWSQGWTQIGDTVYIAPYETRFMSTFNVITAESNATAINTKNNMVNYEQCMTNIDGKYLVLLAGNNHKMEIFDLVNNVWLNDGPPIPGDRIRPTCQYHNGFIYVIGGYESDTHNELDTVLMLNIDDIWKFNEWRLMNDTLQFAKLEARSILWNDFIFVIGGGKHNVHAFFRNVDIIDTVTNTISVGSKMTKGVQVPATILYQNTIFAFGGFIYDEFETLYTKFQFTAISTPSPTHHPTPTPTICGDNKNSGPGELIQCISDEDCCVGFSCRTKKGKCRRDRVENALSDMLQFSNSESSESIDNRTNTFNYLIGIGIILLITINLFNAIRWCCHQLFYTKRKYVAAGLSHSDNTDSENV